jgi:hypothetical protein
VNSCLTLMHQCSLSHRGVGDRRLVMNPQKSWFGQRR